MDASTRLPELTFLTYTSATPFVSGNRAGAAVGDRRATGGRVVVVWAGPADRRVVVEDDGLSADVLMVVTVLRGADGVPGGRWPTARPNGARSEVGRPGAGSTAAQ